MIAAGTTAADVVDFFMALLSFRWIQHPEPTGSRRATPTSHFQQRSGHPQDVFPGDLVSLGVHEVAGKKENLEVFTLLEFVTVDPVAK